MRAGEALYGPGPPKALHGAAIDGLGHGARPEPVGRPGGAGSGRRRGPHRVVGRRRRRVAEEGAVHVVGRDGGVAVVVVVHGGEGGLQVGPLGVLPLPLVRVLVAPQRLRRREVAAAVVALELALFAAAAAVRGHRAPVVVVGRVLRGAGAGRRGLLVLLMPLVGVVVGELVAEEPDGGVPRRRRCHGLPDERQLREGVDAAHLLQRRRHGRPCSFNSVDPY